MEFKPCLVKAIEINDQSSTIGVKSLICVAKPLILLNIKQFFACIVDHAAFFLRVKNAKNVFYVVIRVISDPSVQ